MQDKIGAFKDHVVGLCAKPEFGHHKWFVKWHLEIVERMALELADGHPEADRDLVQVMAWLHDYGKILDWDKQYERDFLNKGRDKLLQIGFDSDFANKAADFIELLDKKLEVDLRQAPIEVQIISTADGCSHMVGPFMFGVWHEATDKLFVGFTLEEVMSHGLKKANNDWNGKIVLPEARKLFESRYRHILEIEGQLPDKFFS